MASPPSVHQLLHPAVHWPEERVLHYRHRLCERGIVTIGGTTAASSFVSSTSLTATTPAARLGPRVWLSPTPILKPAIRILPLPYGSPPSVTSVTPSSGPLAGGTSITITGTGFGERGIRDYWRDTAASSFVSSTSLTATTPIGTVGAKSGGCHKPDTQTSNTNITFYLYGLPALCNISYSFQRSIGWRNEYYITAPAL